jgi:hypothetical protein
VPVETGVIAVYFGWYTSSFDWHRPSGVLKDTGAHFEKKSQFGELTWLGISTLRYGHVAYDMNKATKSRCPDCKVEMSVT